MHSAALGMSRILSRKGEGEIGVHGIIENHIGKVNNWNWVSVIRKAKRKLCNAILQLFVFILIIQMIQPRPRYLITP
jgi:hypothetical protein